LPEDYANPSNGGWGQLPCRANSFLWPRFRLQLPSFSTPREAERSPVDIRLDGITLLSHSKLHARRHGKNLTGGTPVSIVRIGLAETKHFADGYDAIFGKKKAAQAKKQKTAVKNRSAKKKKKTAKK
jgi:hypothetical protein